MKYPNTIFALLLCLILALIGIYNLFVQEENMQDEISQLRLEILHLEKENEQLRQLAKEREAQEQLYQRMEEWLDNWEVSMAEVTAYAPLDPAAKEGMCYEGDPHVAASGAEVIPGVTAAAGPDVEFGTRIWVQGHGRRVVQDRGGRIGPGKIDLAVESREEAYAWGRKNVKVVYQK